MLGGPGYAATKDHPTVLGVCAFNALFLIFTVKTNFEPALRTEPSILPSINKGSCWLVNGREVLICEVLGEI